jgi:Secretion system C-terminal sorting domain
MKKTLTLVIIYLIIWPKISYSQINTFTPDFQRMLKYWYYRDRMNFDFMLGQTGNLGMGIPANERISNSSPPGEVKFADGTIAVSYYVASLAMEYKMLSESGYTQEANSTLDELYFAIETINRLDRFAELDWNKSESLNGFFIRDDVGRDFSNQNGGPDINSPLYQAYLTRLNDGNYGPIPATSIMSDWFDFADNPPFSWPTNVDTYMHSESKDQIIHIAMAAMTVKQCLPNVTYPVTFSHGSNSFSDEVTAIFKGMINYIHSPGQATGFLNWYIRDPDGHVVPRGRNLYSLAYGYSKVYKTITGENNPKKALTFLPSWQAAKAAFLAIALTPYVYTGEEGLKYLNLITASNCCGANASKIYNRSYPNYLMESIHVPPLYQIFHGPQDQQTQLYYEALLDNAPCYGPYNFGGGDYHSWNWSSNSLTIHPERRGQDINVNFPGSYNGLDYLLIYNAYYLAKVNTGFRNLLNRNVLTDYPYTYNNGSGDITIGNDVNPVNIVAIKDITASNIIHSDGNAVYRAGEEINLTAGFHVEDDGYFYGYLEKLHCDVTEQNYYRQSPNAQIISDSSSKRNQEQTPTRFEVSTFPVPFINTFNIKLTIPEMEKVNIMIFDLTGRVIEEIYNGNIASGEHFFTYNLEHLKYGAYICRLSTGQQVRSFKIIKSK